MPHLVNSLDISKSIAPETNLLPSVSLILVVVTEQ